jgi:hypothetical protein
MSLASGRLRFRGRGFVLAAVAAIIVLGAAGTSGAASPSIAICPVVSGLSTCGSTPAPGVAVPYFTDGVGGQPTYISYTVAFQRGSDNNTLTHARVSDPVGNPLGNCSSTSAGCPDAQFAGANVVDVLGTVAVGANNPTTFCTMQNAVFRYPTATPDALHREGVTCPIGSLQPNSTVVMTVVFQVPKQADAGGATALVNQAALLVDESLNDSQPSSSHTDTFPTPAQSNLLTTNVTNAFNTFTIPGQVTDTKGSDFKTNQDLTVVGNLQASEVAWPLSQDPTNLFPGGGLQLTECIPDPLSSLPCPAGTAAVSASPCPLACRTQTSLVIVPGSSGRFFTQNPMTITLIFSHNELGSKFNLSQFVIYHDQQPVNSCKSKTLTDPLGDCISSLTQSKTTGDVTAVITGPANGGWGGG